MSLAGLVSVLLFFGTACAQTLGPDVKKECLSDVRDTSPEGVVTGYLGCDTIRLRSGAICRFTGVPGTTTGWVCEDVAPICGDGIRNRPEEQCDGTDLGPTCTGACVAAGVVNECTCPTTTCGNTVTDAGEECDKDEPEDSCAAGPCNDDCTCPGSCGDGILDPAAGEECETAGAALSFGNALDFMKNGCEPQECARATDSQDRAAFDFQTSDFTVEVWVRPRVVPTSAVHVVFNGTASTVGVGWACGFTNTGLPVCTTGNGTTALPVNGMTAATANGLLKIAFTRAGTTGTLYVADGDDLQYTQDGTGVVHSDLGAPSTQRLSLGATNAGSSAFDGVVEEVRLYNAALPKSTLDSRIGAELGSPTTVANLVGYWRANEAAGATTVADSSVTGATLALTQGTDLDSDGNGPGTVGIIASPFGGETTTTVGCGTGESCNTQTCVCQPTGGSTGNIRYISPSGNDGNPGTQAAPWRTFTFAFGAQNPNRIGPGDTVRLRPGIYSDAAGTGLPALDCGSNVAAMPPATCDGSGATARCGESALPITIEGESFTAASHARLNGTGLTATFTLRECTHYVIRNLVLTGADNQAATGSSQYVLRLFHVDNVLAENILAAFPNRYVNVGGIIVEDSTRTTVRTSNVYGHARHGFSAYRSRFVTFDRVYANSLLRTRVPCTSNAQCSTSYTCNAGFCGGQQSRESVVLYGSSDSLVLNAAVENGGTGINIHGGTVVDGTNGGSNNRILNAIAYRERQGFIIQGRQTNPLGPRSNVCQDCLAVQIGEGLAGGDGSFGNSHSYYWRSQSNGLCTRCTGVDATGTLHGFRADDNDVNGTSSTALGCAEMQGGATCSFTVTGGYFTDNGGTDLSNHANVACTLTNVTAPTSAETCTGTPGTTACAAALFGLGGTACVTHCPSGCAASSCQGRASDNRCLYNASGTKLAGAANSSFVVGSGAVTCTSTANHPCRGAHVSVVGIPIIPGINDGATAGWNFHERLNVDSNDGGCDLAGTADAVECPS